MDSFKHLCFCSILILATLSDAGCTYKIQQAAGCNNPGLFGCRDKPEVTDSARNTAVLTPDSESATENDEQDSDE